MSQTFSLRSACRILSAVLFAFTLITNAAAVTETVLHQFVSQGNGAFPESLVADADGNMYGMTQDGGTYGFGSIFKLSKNSSGKWTQTVLHSFTGLTDGNNYFPYTNENSLIFDKAGNLYGTTPQGGTGGGVGLGVVFKLSPGSNGNWNFSVLYSFKGGKTDGDVPSGPLAFDPQGDLYGTTTFGGNQSTTSCPGASCGTVFRLTPSASGWTEKVVYFFTAVNEGSNPTNGVVIDASGNLYGTTSTFSDVASTVFELTHSSGNWTFTTLHSFSASGDASNPEGVILDSSGNLYGASYQGGVNGDGAVFELAHSSSGWTESVLYSFSTGAGGFSPTGNVSFDASGNLIGVTGSGGSGTGNGVVYKLTPGSSTWTESVLYSFNGGTDGIRPVSNVIFDSAGDIFGVTNQGASANYGTVYELAPSAGTYAENQLYAFPATDGASVAGGLVADSAGNLYGTAVLGGMNLCPNGGYFGCGSVYKLSPASNGTWERTVLHNFTGASGGNSPAASLTFDSAGNLYGTTAGGIGDAGTVFRLSPSGSGWTFRTLYTFGSHGKDGVTPLGNLIFDGAGNIYGTTSSGGNGSYLNCGPCGTVFKLTPSTGGHYTESIIYDFQGLADGSDPVAGLALDSAGNLYGTTYEGGTGGGSNGCGVVYRLSPNSNGTWTQATLYSFNCGSDGGGPEGALVLDAAGNLYGTTPIGGTGSACGYGCGVVFELTASSTVPWNETVIYDFPSSATGAYPESTLTFDKAGNLYGTTNGGGDAPNQFCNQGCGTVFELTPSSGGWQETTLYNFTGPLADGAQPMAGVILDSSGNIYGTTKGGGINGDDYQYGGTVYKIVP
jgi:uncharacterized repeat protein (TIGR03803 family)